MKKQLSYLLSFLIILMAGNVQGQSISGVGMFCVGTTATYAGTPAGGTWSTSAPVIATISTMTGIATGVAAGIATITYTLPSTAFATKVVTVTATPTAGTISGASTVCTGASIALSSMVSGGTWSSSATSVATISSSSGLLTGISAGTVVVTYTVGSTGCVASTTHTVTVTPGASLSAGGPTSFCVGGSVSFTPTPLGGTWASSAPSIASVSGGVVTGLSAGIAFITYTLSSGCTAIAVDTIAAVPSAISGPSTVCVGSNITLTNSVSGGFWASATAPVGTINTSTGVLTGLFPGTTTIYYTIGSLCTVSKVVTVNPAVTMTGAPATTCIGGVVLLTPSVTGGAWSSSSASASVTGGTVSGVSVGTSIITYLAPSSCFATGTITVIASPAPISGASSRCVGEGAILTDATAGGVWSATPSTIATIGSSSGMVVAVSPGVANITYALGSGGCYVTSTLTVNAVPTVTATAIAASCGNTYTLNAIGASTFSWAPSTGLSCTTCSAPVLTPSASGSYSVVGTTAGCSDTAYVTVSPNRIYGHITFSSTTPTSPAMKVWLIQFNPSDSSITSVDSTTTCIDAGDPYYSFDGKGAGNYLVKAKLLSSVPGTSDYIPTYGASTANWYLATNISHGSSINVQNINMIYGVVPSGPGFIGGYVYSGAGKGTAGDVPVAGMLVYLKNTAGQVLSYTYTNASGAYSFGSLAYGSYVVYPEEYSYYTTPSSTITISSSASSVSNADFRQYLTSGVIKPITPVTTVAVNSLSEVSIYPNPAREMLHLNIPGCPGAEVSITITEPSGRVILSKTLLTDNAGQATSDVSSVAAGLYFVKIVSGSKTYTTTVNVQ